MTVELLQRTPQPWRPHAYQKRAMSFLLERSAAGLILDPGMGKTSVTLGALKVLKKQGLMRRALVIAPLRVAQEVWPSERELWKDFHDLTMAVLHGPGKDAALAADTDLCVINPEGLEWLLGATPRLGPGGKLQTVMDLPRFRKLGFDVLVVDELTKFKHIQTNRFKALKAVLPTFTRRWGLTGSPAANGLEGLFGQCYTLDLGKTLGPYITHFRVKFFDPVPGTFFWRPKPGCEEALYEHLKPLMLRMADEDYLKDLPALYEPPPIKVDLPPKARKAYDELEDELLTDLETGRLTAASAGVALGRCQQLANGAVWLQAPGHPRRVEVVHNAKLEALSDLVEELQGQPLLVPYFFQHDLERLRHAFPAARWIGSGTSAAELKENVALWNQNELPILLVHPQAVAHGLNLQGGSASHICWFAQTWNYEHYDQLNRRLKRQGSRAKVIMVHRLVARDTVDEVMVAVLRQKHKVQTALFNELKTYRRRK